GRKDMFCTQFSACFSLLQNNLTHQRSDYSTFPVAVCTGTQNSLSMTGDTDKQYELTKKMYTGCVIVMGNLEIAMMEHTRDFSFLQSIKEVTGYILFAVNEFSRLPLDNLRVIRGNTLFEDRYALAVMLNYQRDGQHGLQELGLTHLTEILDGGVKITQNRNLSYAPQVNWLDIVKDESAHIEIEDNGPKLTKTVCAPQCNGRCFGRNPSECCHNECAGGCMGPLESDCFACKNFNNSGSCVAQCPQTVIYNRNTFKMEPNPNAKYQYGSICVSQCPPNFVVHESSCVSNCPADNTEVEKNGVKRCEPCGGFCPKACEGTGSPNRETVDASNIDSFINCTKIQGSLDFLVTGIKGDSYKNIPALDPEKLNVFSTVQEISDYLNIQSWPESLSNLSVFSNLHTIQGRTLYRGYSLLLVKIESLTSLGLHSLQKINDGIVYISGNKNLCYHNTVNWTRIQNSGSPKENHVCDPLCSSDGCWGPGPAQCVSCKTYRRGGVCVEDCMFLTGKMREFATESRECMPCHAQCKVQEGKETCRGPGADQCVACASLQDGPHCVSSCPEGLMGGEGVIYKYPNKRGRCEQCHINCTQGCTGPGKGGCDRTYGPISGQSTTFIVLGVIAVLFCSFSIFVLSVLYRRGLAIRRKRAMRRYIESGESFEPLEEKEKVHARFLKPSDLRKIKLLGSGVFGTVHKGIWIPEGDTVKLPVAIKTIHDRTGRQDFYQITDLMVTLGSMNHINVTKILGICPGESLQLVSPLSNHGSLLEHVRSNKNKLSPQRLLNWCVQIAKGMNYLEENNVVHRNLAARNVLINNHFTAQVSDYGISELLYPEDKKHYYKEVKTPIKWMALESIMFRTFTHQSDVWSYGVTVWEMMSYGAEPYATMAPQEVPDLLEKGERLSQPQICTIDVYMVMVKCWMIDENVRPTFKELAGEFTRMARDPPRYLVVKQELAHDEVAQRSADLDDFDDLDMEQEDQGAEGVDDMAPAPYYLSKSLSRASWQSRSRLNSARTVSESSEGCSTAVEMDVSEDFPVAEGPKQRRQREDSAYESQRDSMSGGPTETPSPEIEEEDQNGYVLPGGSPERDDEEYEYMNKQMCVTPVSMRSNEQLVEYEYMDIRGRERDESPPEHNPPPPPIIPRTRKEEEEDIYVEDSNYHYTNKQPKLRRALRDKKEQRIEGGDSSEAEEYEDMESFAAPPPADVVVYQNMQREGMEATGSFDNPGYWHSRMFLKPNAVPT
uniref:Receptor protein-tyrosine kinase n=1 Tax=Nothobranchius furzeri TaxID=105023 RepID=A0A8C6LV96_NOTFU